VVRTFVACFLNEGERLEICHVDERSRYGPVGKRMSRLCRKIRYRQTDRKEVTVLLEVASRSCSKGRSEGMRGSAALMHYDVIGRIPRLV
jgi:hypothetical protein